MGKILRNIPKKLSHLKNICGIDEVGRGALAGPLVAASVILPKNFKSELVRDSKKISEKRREKAFKEIMEKAVNSGTSWITPYLWNGAVPYMGAPSIALVGSYENIANALLEYKQIGITQFLFIGWPDIEEIEHFGKGVLPLVRKMEKVKELKQVAV